MYRVLQIDIAAIDALPHDDVHVGALVTLLHEMIHLAVGLPLPNVTAVVAAALQDPPYSTYAESAAVRMAFADDIDIEWEQAFFEAWKLIETEKKRAAQTDAKK